MIKVPCGSAGWRWWRKGACTQKALGLTPQQNKRKKGEKNPQTPFAIVSDMSHAYGSSIQQEDHAFVASQGYAVKLHSGQKEKRKSYSHFNMKRQLTCRVASFRFRCIAALVCFNLLWVSSAGHLWLFYNLLRSYPSSYLSLELPGHTDCPQASEISFRTVVWLASPC